MPPAMRISSDGASSMTSDSENPDLITLVTPRRYPVRSTRYVAPPKKKRSTSTGCPRGKKPFQMKLSELPNSEYPSLLTSKKQVSLLSIDSEASSAMPGCSSSMTSREFLSKEVSFPSKDLSMDIHCSSHSQHSSRSSSPFLGFPETDAENASGKCWICSLDSDGEAALFAHLKLTDDFKPEEVVNETSDQKDENECEKVSVTLRQLKEHLMGDPKEQNKRIAERLHVRVVIEGKRPLRVLSLFDGIGTGIFILEKLGLVLGDYYASEIDKDAISISAYNFEGRIRQLGDITLLNDDDVRALGKFDLLIGGSPCNDLSLVNPDRRGLYNVKSTGFLFFDYVRIKETLTDDNPDLLFLFENTAAMPKDILDDISSYLQCTPHLVDAKHFSPQSRARYFWTNLNNEVEVIGQQPGYKNLASYMTPHCGRKPTVDRIRTLTTNPNCLLQGRNRIPAVLMNDETDTLWITELEEIFGFPRHFTDVGNLSAKRRRQLLGKAWSVPVVSHILKPLRDFFATKDPADC